PPQTGQDISCTAANAQSLTRKAPAPLSTSYFLRAQHAVFPQNLAKSVLRGEAAPIDCRTEHSGG
ncbi:MAG: hypothetical protein WBV78_01710, partial [Roseobacter sp.]